MSGFTFSDLEKLVAEAKSAGVSDSDPVMFVLEQHPQNNIVCTVKKGRAEGESHDGEGNATSLGGTVWLSGVEF